MHCLSACTVCVYKVHEYDHHHHPMGTCKHSDKIQLPLITIPSHPIMTPHVTAAATKLCFQAFPMSIVRVFYTTVCCMIYLASRASLTSHVCICSMWWLKSVSSSYTEYQISKKFLLVQWRRNRSGRSGFRRYTF